MHYRLMKEYNVWYDPDVWEDGNGESDYKQDDDSDDDDLAV
ncbi:MAG: hypothetical protein QXL94_00260 [Candidatus Parvarchaeum sp.]